MRAAAALGLLALGACKLEDVVLVPGDGGGDALPGLLALRVEPGYARLSLTPGGPPQEARFTALGRFAEGERDVSAQVRWSVDEADLGVVEGGLFHAAGAAGRTQLRARSDGQEAAAELELELDGIVLADDARPEDQALFPADTSSDAPAGSTLVLLYPNHEATLPQNLGRLNLAWRAAPELVRFEVGLASAGFRLRFYTRRTSAVLDGALFAALARSHAGRTVELTLRGQSEPPGRVARVEGMRLTFAPGEIPGALYYASTTHRGLMRARLDAPLATRVRALGEACAGCHSLSRDGRSVAYSGEGEALRVADLPSGRVHFPGPGDSPRRVSWSAFSPDGRRLLISDRGQLALLDAQTLAKLQDVPLPSNYTATHPDWAPDGSFIAVALRDPGPEDPRTLAAKSVEDTGIAVLPVSPAGEIGAPRIVVPSQFEHDTLVFPAVSPDSSFIAYGRTREHSRDSRRAELYLVRADGSAPPVALARLNKRSGHGSGRDFGNTMPTWAPSSRPGLAWLAFSSVRPLGSVDRPQDQLWAAAIDLTRAVPGEDPSAAAFWLPFQSTSEAAHRPQWSPAAEDDCISTVDLCGDGVDGDCSGTDDDLCCTAAPEICGNATDDDCDQAADEGCGCAASEICGNGLDDDCDQDIDQRDSECDD